MKRSDLWKSKYLKASELGGQPRIATIQRAALETLKNKGGEDEKLVVYFQERLKPMVLNRVNFDSIVDATNQDDTDNWSGHKIELYPARTEMNGTEVDCVRIRAPAQGDLAAAAPKLADELDDTIPF